MFDFSTLVTCIYLPAAKGDNARPSFRPLAAVSGSNLVQAFFNTARRTDWY